ncbi:hypothetical protein [Halalkalibacter oceani]|uniref:hypothetical protein n=1 Tax=Halalkalibacter oceani TaxID=1653776 RepID=UPI0033972343
MKEVTWVNRGIDERLIIDKVDIGSIDHLEPRELLGLLDKYNILKLKEMSVSEYKDSHKSS